MGDLTFLALEEAAEILRVPKRILIRRIIEQRKVPAANPDPKKAERKDRWKDSPIATTKTGDFRIGANFNQSTLTKTNGGDSKTAISKPKILVVEDHPDSRDILVLAMESWGYEVVEARDGKEAMAQLESVDFNLVVLDIAMPFKSGLDVARSLRSNPRTKDLPILTVTALDTAKIRKSCKEAGFNDFLSKPFRMADLKRKVETLLGQSKRK